MSAPEKGDLSEFWNVSVCAGYRHCLHGIIMPGAAILSATCGLRRVFNSGPWQERGGPRFEPRLLGISARAEGIVQKRARMGQEPLARYLAN